MANATFIGIDAATTVAAALQQSIGSQKAHYSAAVAAALGANPIVEIRVGSTVVYRSTIVGSLSGVSSGIIIPVQFAEPPSVNQANALTADNCVIAFRNATNSGVEVRIPVKVSGSGTFVGASKALDGTNPVRTSSLILRPPTVLDVGSNPDPDPGGDPDPEAQVLVDDMGYNDANPAAALMYGDRWGTRMYGGYASNEYSGASKLAPWYEIVPVHSSSAYPSAPNSRVEVRRLRTWARQSGTWNMVQFCGPRNKWWEAAWYHKMGYDIDTDPNTGKKYETRTISADGTITDGFYFNLNRFRNDPYWVNHGYPSDDFTFNLNPGSGIPICIMIEVRKVGSDAGNVPLLAHIGADWWNNNGRVGASHQGKFKYVTEEWQVFTGTNISTTKGSMSFPGSLTAAQLLANPPPLTV